LQSRLQDKKWPETRHVSVPWTSSPLGMQKQKAFEIWPQTAVVSDLWRGRPETDAAWGPVTCHACDSPNLWNIEAVTALWQVIPESVTSAPKPLSLALGPP
jgi:hypothetical protein